MAVEVKCLCLSWAVAAPKAFWAMGSYRFKYLRKKADIPIANIDADSFYILVSVHSARFSRLSSQPLEVQCGNFARSEFQPP